MSEQGLDKGFDISSLRFLYRKISVSSYTLTKWFEVPSFVEEMMDEVNAGASIDDAKVLAAMKRAYAKILPLKGTENGKVYSYHTLRHGINKLEKACQDQH